MRRKTYFTECWMAVCCIGLFGVNGQTVCAEEKIEHTKKLDYLNSYQAPAQPEDDLTTFTYTYLNDSYRMPTPISEYIHNGFEAETSEIEPESWGLVFMRRDLQQEYFTVYNDLPDLQPVSACYLGFVSDSWKDGAGGDKLVLPGGVHAGDTQAHLFEVCPILADLEETGEPIEVNGIRYSTDEEEHTRYFYLESIDTEQEISFKIEEDILVYIELRCSEWPC